MGKQRHGGSSWWGQTTNGVKNWIGVSVIAALVVASGIGIAALEQRSRALASDPVPRTTFTLPASPTPTVEPAPTAAPRVVDLDFTTLGRLPEETDAGAVIGTRETGRNQSPLAVEDRALRHGVPTGPNAASYLEAPIGKPVDVLGADVIFPRDNPGQIALVVWGEQLTDGGPIPTAGIHFVADSATWHVSVWNNGETNYAEGSYTPGPKDGKTKQTFQIIRSGDRIWIQLPDGRTEGPIQNAAIQELSSEWASWELYEYDQSREPAAFARVWAG